MTDPVIQSILFGTAGLSVLVVMSVVITVARPNVSPDPAVRRRFLILLGAAILAQSMHFAEELATGFHFRFPVLLGLSPWPTGFFVWFNVSWLVLWGIAAFGLRIGFVMALVPVWFLALALVLNGLAHPLMALREGAYFPGLYTSPLVGVLGVMLVTGLRRLTVPLANIGLEPTRRLSCASMSQPFGHDHGSTIESNQETEMIDRSAEI